MSLADNVKQLRVLGGYPPSFSSNDPAEYADKQHEFFAGVTKMFRQDRLRFASDFVEASVQTWDKNGTERWIALKMRFANIVRPSSAIQRHFDDYKQVIPEDPTFTYMRPGTKIRALGSVWLVVNPDNTSGGEGMAMIRRCNAVWNHLDWYGNVLSEPIIIENPRANASNPDTQLDENITGGYFGVTCQYNDFTRQVNDNTRLILGDAGNPMENAKAYQVTGYGNFFREFTEEANSVRLLTFTIRVLTKNEDTDDLVNCVAGGKNFSWTTEVTGPATVAAGKSAQYVVTSFRNGEQVVYMPEIPVDYIWGVSDSDVAVIDQNGVLTAKAPGTVEVTATLEQNPAQQGAFQVTVGAESNGVVIVTPPPTVMAPLDRATVRAAVYNNGSEISANVTWTLSGADVRAFSFVKNGNELSLTCFGYSEAPLEITAAYNGQTATARVWLEDV